MEANQQAFLKIGVYLLLEQARVTAHRCLLKRIYLLGGGNTRVSLVAVTAVLNALQAPTAGNGGTVDPLDEVDLDEAECIVANLIYNGKVKGYISHQKSFLVLSKQDPFPTAAIITVAAQG